MNILVIGLGSMGKRRIRLMKSHMPSVIISGVDKSQDRRSETEQFFSIQTFSSVSDALASAPETAAAFVCTAPLSHYSIIKECLEKNLNIFTEINVISDGYKELIDLAKKNNLLLFLSSTFLYRKDVNYIIDRINKDKCKCNYVYHVGQYLPDWHPWENFKDFFVGEKRTNGCREIFSIEMPWITKAFGNITKINVIKDNISKLDLGYPDNYIVQTVHENGNKGVLLVDIVSRMAVRKLEVFSEDYHIFWEGNPDSLYEYDLAAKENKKIETYDEIERDSKYSKTIIENAYYQEIENFFDCLLSEGGGMPLHTFEKDLDILNLIDKIEG